MQEETEKNILPDKEVLTSELLMETCKTAVWVYCFSEKRIVWANQAALLLWDAGSIAELKDRNLEDGMSRTVDARLKQYLGDFRRDPHITFSENWTLYPKGKPVTTEVTFSGIRVPSTNKIGMLCEARLLANLELDTLRASEALLHSPVMISLLDSKGAAKYQNPAARAAAGIGNRSILERIRSDNINKDVLETAKNTGEVSVTALIETNAGPRWHELNIRSCLDAFTGDYAFLLTETDVTRIREAERKAKHLSQLDSLTGLSNRRHFNLLAARKMKTALKSGHKCVYFFIDLDRFKSINDNFGHHVGDQVLIACAQRISGALLKENAVIARLGGDEFAVFLTVSETVDPDQIAAGLQQVLSSTYAVNGLELIISASVGMAIGPDNSQDVDDLAKFADVAMYAAKAQGGNVHARYIRKMSDDAFERLTLETRLRKAIENGELSVFYQPRVNLKTGAVDAAEALLRWHSPDLGWIPPSKFIPVCEEIGAIRQIGHMNIATICRQQKEWLARGQRIRVSLNVSPFELSSEGFASDFIGQILRNDGDPALIEIEVTESSLLDISSAFPKLQQLRDFGLSVALDDFGTGYSNLAYVDRLPVDCLKIDRSFIANLDRHKIVVEMILSLSRALNFSVVAEGVETEAQLNWLQSRQCDECQGYLFGPAMDPVEFFDWREAYRLDMSERLSGYGFRSGRIDTR